MKPLYLTIEGFETFKNKTEIDFEKLGSNGLYLITGKTGSGKTTIFDAITFALYGEASGSYRSINSIRSIDADENVKTEVTLKFEYRGKQYTVTRNPEYQRKSKRGYGITKQVSEAALILPDGKVVTQTGKVTEKIEEILSLKKDQFCQICMIAQGDFREVLFAKTEKRQEIFRKIFNTELFQRLQLRLSEEEKLVASKVNDSEKSMKQFISGIQISDDASEVLCAELTKARDGKMLFNEVPEILEKGILFDKEKKSNYDKELSLTESKIEKLNKEIAQNQQKIQNARELEKSLTLKKISEEEKNKYAEEVKKQENRKDELEKLRQEIAIEKNEFSLYYEIESKKTKLSLIEKQSSELNSKKDKLNLEIKNTEEKIALCEKEFKQLENSGENKEKYSSEKNQLEERKKSLEKLRQDLNLLDALKKNLSELQKEYKTVSDEAERISSEYKKIKKAFFDEQAGIIAQELNEGKPCPVCGSTHHPAPACKSAAAPTQAELDAMEKDNERAEKKAKEKSEAAAVLVGQIKTGEQNVKALSEALGVEAANIEADIKDAQTKCADIEEKIAIEEKKILRKKELSEQIPAAQKNIEGKRSELSEIEKNISQWDGESVGLRAEIAERSAKLKFSSKAEAERAVAEKERIVNSIIADAKSAQENLARAEKNTAEISGKIKQLEKNCKGMNLEEIQIQEKKNSDALIELQNQKSEQVSNNEILFSIISFNENILKKLKAALPEYEKLKKEHQWKLQLSKTANGNLSGASEKIKLEIFIQMYYFDRVIRKANLRFFEMSNHQYELRRCTVAKDARSQTGLDLEVVDHYKGGSRPVGTLSGGEQFQASLSLALGLADEVQESAGGISLESMFIDEGFGSLDDETLEKAMKTLVELTNGQKLVGIISHVESLKNRIDKQIVVTKILGETSKVEVNA